jgi:hypothetical protein
LNACPAIIVRCPLLFQLKDIGANILFMAIRGQSVVRIFSEKQDGIYLDTFKSLIEVYGPAQNKIKFPKSY